MRKAPEFELNLPKPGRLAVEEEAGVIRVRSGQLSLVIDTENWSMRYERDGKLLTKSGAGDLAYIKEKWTGINSTFSGWFTNTPYPLPER